MRTRRTPQPPTPHSYRHHLRSGESAPAKPATPAPTALPEPLRGFLIQAREWTGRPGDLDTPSGRALEVALAPVIVHPFFLHHPGLSNELGVSLGRRLSYEIEWMAALSELANATHSTSPQLLRQIGRVAFFSHTADQLGFQVSLRDGSPLKERLVTILAAANQLMAEPPAA